MPDFQGILLSAPAMLFGIVIHEVSHGWVAWRLGDPTARMMGRLTLNPLKHIDPIGTVAVPLVLILTRSPFVFGWAKPVPINPSYFRNPGRDTALLSAAGPISNLLTAVVAGGVFRVLVAFKLTGFPMAILLYFVVVNLVLCFINLIPIPPLDGSHILMHLLPPRLASGFAYFERYGLFILLGIMALSSFAGVPIVEMYLSAPLRFLVPLLTGRAIA